MRRHSLPAVALAVIALVGCGGDGGGEADPTPTATAPAPEPTEEATPEATESPDTGDAGGKPETYQVKSGDTLSAIAERFGTTVERLVRLNDIDDPNEIRAGARLKIPPGD